MAPRPRHPAHSSGVPTDESASSGLDGLSRVAPRSSWRSLRMVGGRRCSVAALRILASSRGWRRPTRSSRKLDRARDRLLNALLAMVESSFWTTSLRREGGPQATPSRAGSECFGCGRAGPWHHVRHRARPRERVGWTMCAIMPTLWKTRAGFTPYLSPGSYESAGEDRVGTSPIH